MADGTTPTQIRLTDTDKIKVNEIQTRFGLPSMAAAIRFAVNVVHEEYRPRKDNRKNPRKQD